MLDDETRLRAKLEFDAQVGAERREGPLVDARGRDRQEDGRARRRVEGVREAAAWAGKG